MTIGAHCSRDLIYVSRDVTVSAAAKLMRHYHTGCLIVVDETDGKRVPVGMVTDRDLVVEIYATDLDAKVLTVGDIMPAEIVSVPESLSVQETITRMRAKGVRRAPVVNSDGYLTGFVSIDDVLMMITEELSDIANIVSHKRLRDTHLRQ